MNKKGFINVISKKALIAMAAISISGIAPATAALAHGELVAELVAEVGTKVSGKPGETVTVPVQVWVIPDGGGDKTEASTVTVNLGGQTQHNQTLSFAANELNIKKTVELKYTIPEGTPAGSLSLIIEMSSNVAAGSNQVRNNQVKNNTEDKVTLLVEAPAPPADTTAPSLTVTTALSGWYNEGSLPQGFEFTLDEASEVLVNEVSLGSLSAGKHDAVLPAPNQGLNTVKLRAVDAVGNESKEARFSYSYDSIAPVVTATPARNPDVNGWYNKNVTVSFDATDTEGSGVQSITENVNFTEDGVYEVDGSATDNAGNTGASETLTIQLDKTAPTITGSIEQQPNAAGWYKDDVTVSFSAVDNLSDVDRVTGPVTISTEGTELKASGSATDRAGNSISTTVSGIKIDKTKPVIHFEENQKFKLNEAATWSASDELSGLKTPESGVIDTSSPGSKSVTIEATDNAGNKTVKTVNYTVVYDFGGVLQPINASGSSVFKAGSTVPVKFQLKDANGTFVSNAVASIRFVKVNNQTGDVVEAVYTNPETSGNLFRYDLKDNQYIFNLSTKGLSSGTYQLSITLDDGTTQTVIIGLK